jgi:threonine dehydrogenase-like Zn-dependent dehydrogenase
MLALRFINGSLSLRDTHVPTEPDGEALVRVLYSGICSTDLEIIRGYADFEGTIGHEFVGVVERADAAPELVGRRVVGEINAGCGTCPRCVAGDPRHCPDRTVLGIKGRDGAHAEFLRLPSQNLLAVPDQVPDEQAVFVEPLAAAYGITERVTIGPQTRLAVVGDGKLGILCALALALQTPNTSLVGKHSSKLSLVEDRGIQPVMLGEAGDLAGSFDIVVEASGSAGGFDTALDLVRPAGTIVLKSTFHGRSEWPAWRVVVNEISVVGSRCGRFGPAIALLAENRIDLSGLISDVYDLNDGISAIARAGERGVLKVLLRMPG